VPPSCPGNTQLDPADKSPHVTTQSAAPWRPAGQA
jgi:hypothetical protein